MRDPNRRSLTRAASGRFRARAAALALLAPLCLGEQCSVAPPIRILDPGADAALTHMPLRIEIEYSADLVPGSLRVQLNGVDITGWLQPEPPAGGRISASADFVWGAAFVLDGPNQLLVSLELQGSEGVVRRAGHGFRMQGDPYADSVESLVLGASGGFGVGNLDGVVLGPPFGAGLYGGGLDVVSLGLLGEIVLGFTDNVIVDGPGVDFTVFENAFLSANNAWGIVDTLFSEAGEVSVSQDGLVWHVFPCAGFLADAPLYAGCAGVYPVIANGESDARHPSVPTLEPPVGDLLGMPQSEIALPDGSGGDSFDLADVGLAWARYVRIRAADHVNGPYGPDNAGFDLDAVAAVHSLPASDADGNGVPDALE